MDIRQELTDGLVGSGIEAELTISRSDTISVPFNPDQIDVTTRNPTVDLLISRVRSGSIDLAPDFQRKTGIWTNDQQSRLIESLLLRIPLPTLYAAEDHEERWAIVDGIQRLSTIVRFIDPDLIHSPPLQLTGLEYLGADYHSATFSDLPGRLQLRLRETELVLHLIRNGTPEEVMFNIFARINTGGMPLSAQELRHAIIPGPARDLLKDMAALPSFANATNHSIRDERMADREMALRFSAFYMFPAEGYGNRDFDEFLRRSMRVMNNLPEATQQQLFEAYDLALKRAKRIFGRFAFRKVYARSRPLSPINKALFDAQTVALLRFKPSQANYLADNKDQVLEDFEILMTDKDFESSISQGTGDVAKVRYRFARMTELLEGIVLKDD